MTIDRRSFIKIISGACLSAASAEDVAHAGQSLTSDPFGCLVDLTRCIGSCSPYTWSIYLPGFFLMRAFETSSNVRRLPKVIASTGQTSAQPGSLPLLSARSISSRGG